EVTLEILGHNADTIRRISDDRRRAAARETIRQALAVQVNQEPGTPPQNGGETPEQGAPDNATKLSQQATPPAQAPAAE
ncbi:hypothetical protein, partial [Glaesserella parasuis]|uniref:hypothetical protein n=1 Tax=Glaesserella parasuis TaxID=738 RepID=UPI003F2BE3B1